MKDVNPKMKYLQTYEQLKISPSLIKYLAALISGNVVSPTCSNVCYTQVQKVDLHTPVKQGGVLILPITMTNCFLKSVFALQKVVGDNLKITVIVPTVVLLTGTIQ